MQRWLKGLKKPRRKVSNMCATCGCGQRDKTHPKYGKGPNKGKIKKKDIKMAKKKDKK